MKSKVRCVHVRKAGRRGKQNYYDVVFSYNLTGPLAQQDDNAIIVPFRVEDGVDLPFWEGGIFWDNKAFH